MKKAKDFKRGDICTLLKDYTVKLGDGLFHVFKRGTPLVIRNASKTAIDNFEVYFYGHRSNLFCFSIRFDFLRKLSPLELLALQAPKESEIET